MRRPSLAVLCTPIFVYLVAPTLIVVPMAFSASTFLEFPPAHLSMRWFNEYITDERWLLATWRSLRVAFSVMVLATVIGTLAALALQQARGRTATLLKLLILSPIMLPVIIYAIAVYALYSRLHLVGTDLGLVLAHTILAVPFVFLTVTATSARYNVLLDRAAASSGAGPWRTFWEIRLPLIRRGVLAGALFAFITSFDEVVVALFVGGLDATLPKRMFDELRWNLNPTIAAVATILVSLTTLVLWAGMRSRRPIARES